MTIEQPTLPFELHRKTEGSPFVEAAQKYIDGPDCTEIEREVIGHLLAHCVGAKNATPLGRLAGIFRVAGKVIQNKVIVKSRKHQYRHFIASCSDGIFIIATREDAELMQNFYENRIAAEQCHTRHLRQLRETNDL